MKYLINGKNNNQFLKKYYFNLFFKLFYTMKWFHQNFFLIPL